MNPFPNSFPKPSVSHPHPNLSPHLFQDSKEMTSFSLGIDPATLLALQSQQSQILIPQHQKIPRHLLHHEDLDPHQSSKKFKSNNGGAHMILEPQKTKLPSFPLQGQNKNLIEQQMQREAGLGLDPRQLGLDMQMQQQFFGNNFLNAGIPSLENLGRGQVPFLPEQNFLSGLGSIPTELLARNPSEPLLIQEDLPINANNLAKEQALRNILLLQALQNPVNPVDLISNRITSLQQRPLLNNPQLQSLNAVRMPVGNGMNPLLAYQYLEAQKRLESEYASMQAHAQILQSTQRLQNEALQGVQLSELLDPRRQIDGLSLEKLGNPSNFAEYNKKMEEAKAIGKREVFERQIKRGNEMEPTHKGGKIENSKIINLNPQQSLQPQVARNHIQPQQATKSTNGFAQQIKINGHGQKSEIKKELPAERIQIEQPKKMIIEKNSREAQLKMVKESTKHEPTETLRQREAKRALKNQQEIENKRIIEEERNNRAKERSLRAQRYTQRYEAEIPSTSSLPKKELIIQKPLPEVGIIQFKDKFAKRLREGYTIEVHSLNEKLRTSYKRTPIGRLHQAIIRDCELNDNHKNVEEKIRPYKLISRPTHYLGVEISNRDDIESPYFDPMTKAEGLKEIKVGEPYQAAIADFDLNLEADKHRRLCRLVDGPNF